MAITLPKVVSRVRKNVLDKIVAPQCRPTMPLHKLSANPCLGIPVVGALATRLRNEFKPESLDLSSNELETLYAGKETVMDLGSVVYQRIRPYSTKVQKRVIATIKSLLSNPSTPVKPSTILTGPGGLGLSETTVRAAIRLSFIPLIRIKIRFSDIDDKTTVGDLSALIEAQFKAQGR